MAKRPLSAFGLNRAMTSFSKNAAQTLNPRFQVVKRFKLTFKKFFLLYFHQKGRKYSFFGT
jgi:hypothetical protein